MIHNALAANNNQNESDIWKKIVKFKNYIIYNEVNE